MIDRSMTDAASGGALMDKTPATARGPNPSRIVNEIGTATNQRMENQLAELTILVRQLTVGQQQPAMAAKIYGICTSVEHSTDMCPMLQETEWDQLKNVGVIVAWKIAISARTESRALCSSTIRVHTEYILETSRLSTADSAISSTTFPTTTIANVTTTIQDLKKKIGQLTNTVSHFLSAGSSNFPSQTIPNPRVNTSVVTLKSGKELPQPTLLVVFDSEPNADSQSRPEKTAQCHSQLGSSQQEGQSHMKNY
ncbi:hypothetical protein CR513_10774, partial [Mucuna pruriens]